MKKPQEPPDWTKLREEVWTDKKLQQRLGSFTGPVLPTIGGRYLHWDKLRRLCPPDGLTTRMWWASVKWPRVMLHKQIPLTDTKSRPFVFAMPDEAWEYLHLVDQHAGGRLEAGNNVIAQPDTRDRYLLHSLVDEAITSSQLEGATTTRRVANEMIRNQRAPRDTSEQMILNNYLTMRMIGDRLDRPLTPELLLEFHAKLAEHTLETPDAVGRFRRPDEDIHVFETFTSEVMHTPPPAAELPARIEKLCAFANGRTPGFYIPPVVRAIILHFWLAYDHPFVDGNGRCARALFYWLMRKQGAWLCEFISISSIIKKAPSRYARAFLYTESDDNDLTYFILYHLEVIKRAFDALHEYLRETTNSVRRIEALIRAPTFPLNARQIALLSDSLRHPNASYTVKSHQTTNRTAYDTARTDLQQLSDMGLLRQRKQGKKTLVYSPVPDLEKRLSALR